MDALPTISKDDTYSAQIITIGWRTARVTGNTVQFRVGDSGSRDDVRLYLELENAGWRINKITLDRGGRRR